MVCYLEQRCASHYSNDCYDVCCKALIIMQILCAGLSARKSDENMTCAFAELVQPTAAVDTRPVYFVEPLFLFRSETPHPASVYPLTAFTCVVLSWEGLRVCTVALCNRQTLTSFISDHLHNRRRPNSVGTRIIEKLQH